MDEIPDIDMTMLQRWMMIAPLLILFAAAVEGIWLQRRDGSYDWRAFWTSVGDLLLRAVSRAIPFGTGLAAFGWLWDHRLYTMPTGSAAIWILLFIGQEFCYYWMHRADHSIRWLWATHAVHHSPNALNLSAAFRLGWTTRLSLAPLFFAPLVLIGFEPRLVAACLALNLLYQFWLHAACKPRLGWLEWVLNTPTHHSVHHASNLEYLDANFGGVLIVFDRLFGTFKASSPGIRVRYGLTTPVTSYSPVRIGLSVWLEIWRDLRAARGWRQVVDALVRMPAAAVPRTFDRPHISRR